MLTLIFLHSVFVFFSHIRGGSLFPDYCILLLVYICWHCFIMRFYHLVIPITLGTAVLPCLGESATGTVTIVHPVAPTTDQRPLLRHNEFEREVTEEDLDRDLPTALEGHLPASRLRRASNDVTKSLDYKCGEKWGRCPSGTCCSSVGEWFIKLEWVFMLTLICP